MKTINLLPPDRQSLLRLEGIFRALLSVIWLSLLSFALVFLVQLGVKFYLQSQAAGIKESIARLETQVKKQENVATESKINDLNNLIADYKNFSQDTPKWYNIVKALAALPPDGVTINSFSIDFKTLVIQISGTAATRDEVIKLHDNILADDKEFYGIDYPLENINSPNNISYHYTFTARDTLLK